MTPKKRRVIASKSRLKALPVVNFGSPSPEPRLLENHAQGVSAGVVFACLIASGVLFLIWAINNSPR